MCVCVSRAIFAMSFFVSLFAVITIILTVLAHDELGTVRTDVVPVEGLYCSQQASCVGKQHDRTYRTYVEDADVVRLSVARSRPSDFGDKQDSHAPAILYRTQS